MPTVTACSLSLGWRSSPAPTRSPCSRSARGCTLRGAGITAPLFAWLHGTDSDFGAAIEADIQLGVSSLWQLEAILLAGHGRIHLKVDTGLHRNGANPEDWPELVTAAVEAQEVGLVTIEAIWSHLADAVRAG